MESNSETMRIHISSPVSDLLHSAADAPNSGFSLAPRGRISVKGKGEMDTWWVLRDCDLNENGVNVPPGGRALPPVARAYSFIEPAAGEKS